jgi:hypothetical protein
MKETFLSLAMLLLSMAGLAQFSDNFSDGDFTNNPAWTGDVGDFIVENQQLRSAGPDAISTIYLSTASSIASKTEWNFLIDLRFNPTATNAVRVYLMSDQANLKGSLNGYFIQIGQTGNDFVKLFRQDGNTLTERIPGSVASFSGNVLVRVKVIRNAVGQWFLYTQFGGNPNFQLEGTVLDNTHSTTSHFGVYCTYATTVSSRKDQFFFDDFEVFQDNTPPQLSAVQVLSPNQIELRFNENVDLATAQTLANYSVNNGIGTPNSAVRSSPVTNAVVLTFANSFTSALPNTLSVNNVQDLAGNALSNQQINFTFFAVSPAVLGDVIINEIMADPDPPVGLPNSEYAEIYNRSDKFINIQGWRLEGTGTSTFPSLVIPPGGYVLICPSGNVGLYAGDVVTWGTSNSALTNAGQTITLRDAANNIIDQVTYSDTWYRSTAKRDGGWSLERINPTLPCSSANNWIASVAPLGGTPNLPNSVLDNSPDTAAPLITGISIAAVNRIVISFNEPLAAASIGNLTVVLSGGLSVQGVSANAPANDQLEITFESNLQLGLLYSIRLNGLTDCSGNALSDNERNFGLGAPPEYNEVIITEIFADPSPIIDLPEREFVEIFNRTDKVISLDGCRLIDNTSRATFGNVNILPGEYLIVTSNSGVVDFEPYGRTIGLTSFPSLNNGGEQLILRNAAGRTIFEVTYSDTWYNDDVKRNGGWTLEMIDTENPCLEQPNWTASEDPSGGTPGRENSVKGIRNDNTPPQLERANAINAETLVLIFSEKMDSLSLQNGTYRIAGRSVVQVAAIEPQFRRVRLQVSPPFEIQTRYEIEVENVADCNGNFIAGDNRAFFGIPEQADSSDILLNEILFNPRTGGSDFVEIYNRSSKYINLRNWKLARLRNEVLDSERVITTEDFILNPQEYLVLTNNVANIQSNYPRSVGKEFLQMNSLPAYNNDAGIVILIDNLNKIVERFDYNEDFHFRLIRDRRGVSLERISFDVPTNRRESWFSAASTEGYATPGYRNSQQKREGSSGGTISIEPKVFTPDEDGQSDFTTIFYRFANSGNVANITIYDSRGREVKQLARNQLLATEGFFIWDGTNEQRAKVRTGYYVVMLQVYNLDGSQEFIKETVAVTDRF